MTDKEIEHIVQEGMSNMFGKIQDEIDVDTGDYASMFWTDHEDNIVKPIVDMFKEYINAEQWNRTQIFNFKTPFLADALRSELDDMGISYTIVLNEVVNQKVTTVLVDDLSGRAERAFRDTITGYITNSDSESIIL